MEAITLSLISHTNVGKTTLARTFLRRDVGEVLDQAHVTELSEAHILIATPRGELRLWDTPGFGDSTRLMHRLRRHDQPVLWFVQQLWDRLTDRPLWCGQQAVLNVQQEADVVLYMVNATEDPDEAGYLYPELELLTWIGRPMLVLLNQTGGAAVAPRLMAERREMWRRALERFDLVRDVIALDAFSRAWVQEGLLLERLIDVVPEARRELMRDFATAWNQRLHQVFERSLEALASYLTRAAADREALEARKPSRASRERAMAKLGERLEESTRELMGVLLAAHGLEGKTADAIEKQIDAFVVQGLDLVDTEKGAVLGGVISGAVGGLTADLMSGGLTFGGGLLAGAILGALGGAGLAKGYQLIKGNKLPEVSWSPVFLDQLAIETLLRYLAVAHFGRGRGELLAVETPERWRTQVRQTRAREAERWSAVWKEAADLEPSTATVKAPRDLAPLLEEAASAVLIGDFPDARRFFKGQHQGNLTTSGSERAEL